MQIGFHAPRSDQLVPLQTCDVVRPELLAALPAIADAARIGGSRKGVIRATVTLTEGGLDLSVDGGKPLAEIWSGAAALAETHDLARLTWSGSSGSM